MKDTECNGGDIIDDIKPINMTNDKGTVICGVRGGPTFLETVRPDFDTRECPKELIPCSSFTSVDDTVCINPEDVANFKCPIVEILLASEDELDELHEIGYQSTEQVISLATSRMPLHFVFSTNVTTGEEVSGSPIVSSAINTEVPCFGPDYERLVFSTKQF